MSQLLRLLNGGREKDVSWRNISKSINFWGILADPSLKMIAFDPPGIIASIAAFYMGSKAFVVSKASLF